MLAKALDGDARLMHAGINHRDVAPRNLMPVPAPQEMNDPQPLPRVVLIDYNIAEIYERSKTGRWEWQDHELPQNPAELYWNRSAEIWDFRYWLPKRFRIFYKRVQQVWLLEQFCGERTASYHPLERELEHDPLEGDALGSDIS